ncbi:MAG: hypothetical protein ACRDRE_14550 [Pseudonocardiaceae bacterium]
MDSDWRHDMAESSYAFQTYVWPKVRPLCGEGRLEPVESPTAKEGLARDFNMLAGVDAWQLLDDRGFMRAIGARVQADSDYRTFTVRKDRFLTGAKTEYAKLTEAIKNRDQGAIYPALSIHAYVRDYRKGPLLSAAVVRTVDLCEYLDIQISERRAKTRKTSNADFYYVYWKELAASGVKIHTWPSEQASDDGK